MAVKEDKKVEAKPQAPKKVRFWAVGVSGYSCAMPLYDENGKRMPLMKNGQAVMQFGEIKYITYSIKFIEDKKDARGTTRCFYDAEKESEINRLWELVKDGTTPVIDDKGYRMQLNKAAVELEEKLKEKDDEIAELKKQIEELTKPGK